MSYAVFSLDDAKRIRDAVKTVESGGGNLIYRRKKHSAGGGGGTTVYWAKVTAVTDANNYTVDIYDRSDESTAIAESQQCRVHDIVDEMVVGDWFPVQTSNIEGEAYESIQQMGAVG